MIIDALRDRHERNGRTAQRLHPAPQGWIGINGSYDYTDGSQRGIGIDAVVIDRWDAAKDDFVIVSKAGGGTK